MIKEHKKIERLMLFSEVASQLSFTAASEKLGVSRGHLSSQIRQLEKDMGFALLIRSTRSVRLTSEGERVLAGMEGIRRSLIELERNAENEGTAFEGVIKITAPSLFTERFLLDIIYKFRQRHPKIEFVVDSSYISHDLNTHDFDIAFRATNSPPQNMVAKQLFTYKHCCCASPKYFKKNGKPLHFNELGSHQCISVPGVDEWAFISEKVAINPWLHINDNHMLKHLALAGKGIIRIPKYVVDTELNSGALVQVFEADMPINLGIYLVFPPLVQRSKKVSAFIDFTKAYFGLEH